MEKIENAIKKLKTKKVVKAINAFVFSNWFIFAMACLTIVGNVFSLELYAYAVVTVFAVFISLFGRDYLPYIPMFGFCYIMPNVKNNPGVADESIFYLGSGGKAIIIMACFVVAALLFRLTIDKKMGFKHLFKTKHALRYGLLALLVGYLSGGIGSPYFSKYLSRHFLFSLLQFFSIALPYFLITGLVRWGKADKGYFAYVGLAISLVVGVETVSCYFTNNVITEGSIARSLIYTGWGNGNNMGVLIAMSIPYAFYFIYRGEKVVFYNALAILLAFFSALTCSRGAILGAGVAYFGCLGFICFSLKDRKIRVLTVCSGVIFILILFLIGFTKLDLLKISFAKGLDSSGRIDLYKEGMQDFLKNPIFGATFYSISEIWEGWSILEKFTGFFPARWHNTVVQLLASCGIVGLIGYGFHRAQTVRLFFKYRTPEKTFIMFSILVFLGLSLIDCHFFNVGPTLIYSCALAFAEGMTRVEKNKEAVE